MTFRLYKTLTGGTACWTESQNVNVQNGQFSVLLGKTSAITASCLSGTNYLELVVGGETLSPREVLASVPYSVQANSLPADAKIGNSPVIAGDIIAGAPGNEFIFHTRYGNNSDFLEITSRDSGGGWKWGHGIVLVDATGNVGIGTNNPQRKLDVAGDAIVRGSLSADATVRADYLTALNIGLNDEIVVHQNGRDRILHILPWSGGNYAYDGVCFGCGTENAYVEVRGRVAARSLIVGNCQINVSSDSGGVEEQVCDDGSIISGAYIEANLMTNEERASEKLDYFERGDLLCWSADEQQLGLCETANDRLVMAVADANGKPIVLGAEMIKVVGPVVAGDLLVASDVPGYAMANNNAPSGAVIGQALQDLDGESGIIKAMIRKW